LEVKVWHKEIKEIKKIREICLWFIGAVRLVVGYLITVRSFV
jgi:hypothetical protein